MATNWIVFGINWEPILSEKKDTNEFGIISAGYGEIVIDVEKVSGEALVRGVQQNLRSTGREGIFRPLND